MSDKITPKMIQELRERTGVGMSKCKEALAESGGDISKAIEYLRKIGEMTAAKKELRATNEGMIAYDSSNETIVLLEINAETDFVVKNEKFQAFAHSISRTAVKYKPKNLDELLSLGSDKDPTMTIDQFRSSMVQMFGENIVIKRMELIKKKPDASYGIYSHMNGKIVSVVEITGATNLEALAKDVAMHVAAENPEFLSPSEVPETVKKQEEEIARTQLKNKPKEVIDKIIEGKIRAYCNEVCLLSQKYIRDPSKSVEQFIEEESKKGKKSLKLTHFWRWKTGQAA